MCIRDSIIAFLIGFNNKILGIARLSFVPNITNDLVKFNALLRSINRFALISGSLLFSVIINYSLTLVFVIDAVTYILSAYLLYRLNKNVRIQSHSTISKKTIRESIYDRIQLLLKGYKLLFLNKKINFIVYLGILARIFYMCIPILQMCIRDRALEITSTADLVGSKEIVTVLSSKFTSELNTPGSARDAPSTASLQLLHIIPGTLNTFVTTPFSSPQPQSLHIVIPPINR